MCSVEGHYRAVLHPGVPVMSKTHIRDLSPTAEAARGTVMPNVTKFFLGKTKVMLWCRAVNEESVRRGFLLASGGSSSKRRTCSYSNIGFGGMNRQLKKCVAAHASLIPVRTQISKNFVDVKKKGINQKHQQKQRVNIVLNNEEAPMYDTTDTCSRDCGVHATVPTERTVSRKSRHD